MSLFMRRRFFCISTIIALTAVFAAATKASAQLAFVNGCTAQTAGHSQQLHDFCNRVGIAAEGSTPRVGIAATGGNPLPGTASTLGMRLRSMPRISFDIRATSAFVDLPNVTGVEGGSDLKYAATSIDVDASAGVFSGLSVFPTIGGFGSIDVIASAGIVKLPKGKGFNDSPKTYAAGARVGILRESFTAPGISLSAMYRRVGDNTYGDSTFTSGFSSFTIRDMSMMSYRAAIGKRIPVIGLGLLAGVGVDNYKTSATIRGYEPGFNGFGFNVTADDVKTSRTNAFVNASWTMLVLNISGELGWQKDGSGMSGTGIPTLNEKGGLFGGVAVRVAL
jgi:hypothetical protein